MPFDGEPGFGGGSGGGAPDDAADVKDGREPFF